MAEPKEPDDSVDLVELITVLWLRKWQIALVAAPFVLAGLAYALLATEVYRSEVVLAPNTRNQAESLTDRLGGLASLAGLAPGMTSDVTNAVATLRSRAFAEDFIRDKDLLPVLFADDWDAQAGRWITEDPEDQPDIRDGVKLFVEDIRSIEEDSAEGLITLSVEWTDPAVAAQWAAEMVERVNERLRARDLRESELRLEYLNSELDRASLVELRQAISRLIQNQVEMVMLAQAEEEYAFTIIDPPREPKERVWPARTLIVLAAGFCGALIGVLVALFRWQLSSRGASGDE